ncbi:MAG: hypothetical protein IH571_06890, partial [Acholeplasmataceae bacterium]|nr:hypothetical protein [Acholeplasmataceae bacterium]
VGRIVYIVAIALISVQVYGFAFFSKLQAYYEEHVVEHIDDEVVFFKGINTLMGLDYYRESPLLYEETINDGDYQLRISIRAVGATSDGNPIDGLAILVNNIKILENEVEVENPIIRVTVQLDSNTLLVGDDFSNRGSIFYNPEQPFAYYNVPILFLFDTVNYMKDAETDAISSIERIEVSYSNGLQDDDKNYVFNPSFIFLATTGPNDEAVLGGNKDEAFVLDQNLYQLQNQFLGDTPSETELETFGLNTERDDLGAYNHLVWRTMIIYVLIVSLVTYLLFFHKRVREHFKMKHVRPKILGSEGVHLEDAIFKDIEEKDGK